MWFTQFGQGWFQKRCHIGFFIEQEMPKFNPLQFDPFGVNIKLIGMVVSAKNFKTSVMD